MEATFVQLLRSPGVSPQTRRVLADRTPLQDYQPQFFTEPEWHLIQQLSAAILPQTSPATGVPCAALIDHAISTGAGPGWRYAALPAAPDAYRTALHLLQQYLAAQATPLPSLLEAVQRKDLDTPTFPLSLWLESLKVDLVRFWLASPVTMAALDYRGFADQNLTPHDSLEADPA